MRIADLLKSNKQFFSLEFFPPKDKLAWPAFFKAVERLKSVNPLFTSVTYGAGGGTQANTLELVTRFKKEYDLEPMAHLTCVGASDAAISGFLNSLVENGIDNVLALRGDPPKGDTNFKPDSEKFRHASDLVKFIRENFDGLGVGVAGYPETHPEAVSAEDDLRNLKNKLDMGGDFVVTQLFFDNAFYRDFVSRARAAGVEKPILPGVLPVVSLKGIQRMISFCGAKVPDDYMAALEAAHDKGGDEAVEVLGVEYAKNQVKDLLDNGAPGVHLYTLNRAEACLSIVDGLLK